MTTTNSVNTLIFDYKVFKRVEHVIKPIIGEMTIKHKNAFSISLITVHFWHTIYNLFWFYPIEKIKDYQKEHFKHQLIVQDF